jgi:hypothetical protein
MTVVPARVDLTIYQGSDFSQVVTFLQTSGGTPVDLTGLTGRMQIRQTLASSDIIMDLTTANGRLTFGGATGVVTMTLTATETATILTDGVYDLEFVTSATSSSRWLEGSIILSKEVTR